MDTGDLSEETYRAILIEAENFNHDLTLQFGLLSGECKDENDFIKKSILLIEEMKKFDAIDDYDNKLSYESLPYELKLMKQDTTLVQKRKRWHKNLSKDIYVEEAVNILQDLKLNNIKAGKVANIKN